MVTYDDWTSKHMCAENSHVGFLNVTSSPSGWVAILVTRLLSGELDNDQVSDTSLPGISSHFLFLNWNLCSHLSPVALRLITRAGAVNLLSWQVTLLTLRTSARFVQARRLLQLWEDFQTLTRPLCHIKSHFPNNIRLMWRCVIMAKCFVFFTM